MKLVKAGFTILNQVDRNAILAAIEAAGRTCYKSEDKITDASAEKFVIDIIARGHESVLEHQSISVRIICDRGVSHELVRHRIASFSQESTRFCNYSKNGHVTFIIPPWTVVAPGIYPIKWNHLIGSIVIGSIDPIKELPPADNVWFWNCAIAERDYYNLLSCGWQPQQARSALTNSLKTEIVITQNLRQWRHFFKLRAAGEAGRPHPQMLEITVPMLAEFKRLIPIVFDDIEPIKPF